MTYRHIALQAECFDPAAETRRMEAKIKAQGATVTFVGSVRDDDGVSALSLEHYPGMTEAALERISDTAFERWALAGLTIVHRIGTLMPGDPIVLVITMAAHRRAAFDANMFLMDYLKTEVPLWKKEQVAGVERWVESTKADQLAARAWFK